MRRECRCRLCGTMLTESKNKEYSGWEISFCSYLCYLTDALLPIVPIEESRTIYRLSSRVIMARYELIISGDSDPIYKGKFEEEEDNLMRKE